MKQTHASPICPTLALLCVLTLVLGALAMPATAMARDYSIEPVSIDATVQTDGSLVVVEDRTFNFDGHYNGVYWDIPKGEHEGRQIGVDVVSAQRNTGNGWEEMRLVDDAEAGDDAVLVVRDRGGIVRAQIFSQSEDQSVIFRITYVVTNGVSAWHDVGELYWKFVSDGWDEPSESVSCTIHLPVPAGTTVTAGESVRAWAHGPLNGEVTVTNDGAAFTVPEVGTSEYAEARITFPVEWLRGMTPAGTPAFDGIIAEETAWADEANAARERARRNIRALLGGGGVVAVASAAVAWASRARYRRLEREAFSGAYYRDVPSADHPAVLGALYNGGKPDAKEFTATLMRLSDMGCVGLDLVTTTTKRGKQKRDYRITRNDLRMDALNDRIDRKADYFLFRYLALRAAGLSKPSKTYETGFPPLDFSRVEKVAKKYPNSYNSNYEDWKSTVRAECEMRGFFTSEVRGGRTLPIVTGILALLCAFGVFIGSVIMEVGIPGIAVSVLLLVMAIVLFVVAAGIRSLSREAMELMGKMRALRRWLRDFTRLGDAVPQDVVLWNRLLVMAVVLGVADEVIEQLRVAAPQVLSDPGFAPSYYWVTTRDHGVASPARAFTDAATSAAHVSMAELASSSSSSGGGGGGGFSGGGGGGFGGGGGGGAF